MRNRIDRERGRSGKGTLALDVRDEGPWDQKGQSPRREPGLRDGGCPSAVRRRNPGLEKEPKERATWRVLLVDDEQTLQQALVDVLRYLGYEAEGVSSGNEAVTVFEGSRYDLLVTDYRMPGMNGAELIRRLRRRYPFLPVVGLTGAGAEAETELRAAGAAEVLKKPVGIHQLRDAVERALKESSRGAEANPDGSPA